MLYEIFRVNITEKSPWASSKGRGRGTSVKYARGSVLNKACPWGQSVNLEPNLLGYYRGITDLREGKHPVPTISSHPIPLKGRGKNWETPVKFLAQSHKLTKDWDLSIVISNASLSTTPVHDERPIYRSSSYPVWIHHLQLSKTKNCKAHQKTKNTIWRDRIRIRIRHGRDVGNMRPRF